MKLSEAIREELGRAVRILPPDVENLIRSAAEGEASANGRKVLSRIIENIEIAKGSLLPLCQDTGMFSVLVEAGAASKVNLYAVDKAINVGCLEAAKDFCFRKSIVSDPLFERENTQTNMPASITYLIGEGEEIKIGILLKGFGSENCSGVRLLRPTSSEEEVISAVEEIMKAAGGKPCPPVFLGVGIGGTMDKAALLSKKALLRDAGRNNSDERYALLEARILDRVNTLGIGPGGLGGEATCLSVAVEYMPTHIAGLPVAVSVNCWADRKAVITFKEGEVELC